LAYQVEPQKTNILKDIEKVRQSPRRENTDTPRENEKADQAFPSASGISNGGEYIHAAKKDSI